MAKLCETSYLKLLGRWNGYFVDHPASVIPQHSDDIAKAKNVTYRGLVCLSKLFRENEDEQIYHFDYLYIIYGL